MSMLFQKFDYFSVEYQLLTHVEMLVFNTDLCWEDGIDIAGWDP